MKRDEKFLLALLLVMAGYLLLGTNVLADQVTTSPSNVTVSAYVAIGLSNNFTSIEFGGVSPLDTDVNGSHNYDGPSTNSSYVVLVSTDSNQASYLCVRDNWDLNSSGGDIIGNTNYTWNTTISGGPTDPTLPGTAITTVDDAAWSSAVAAGQNLTFRFWLDIPASQAAGTYNNTVYITGKTSAC
jgi:hypothetical protein